MKLTNIALGLAALASVGSTAAVGSKDRICGPDEVYVINKAGKIKYRLAPSLYGTTVGCVPRETTPFAGTGAKLGRRQSYETTVQVDNDEVNVAYFSMINDDRQYPPQFTDMFNRILGECCGPVSCRESCQVCEYAVEGASPFPPDQVCLSASGHFADEGMRGNFFELMREAFDKGVRGQNNGGELDEWGPEYMAAVSNYGDASGYTMTLEFSRAATSPGCGELVNRIMSLGALVPHLGQFFGYAGAACGAVN